MLLHPLDKLQLLVVVRNQGDASSGFGDSLPHLRLLIELVNITCRFNQQSCVRSPGSKGAHFQAGAPLTSFLLTSPSKKLSVAFSHYRCEALFDLLGRNILFVGCYSPDMAERIFEVA